MQAGYLLGVPVVSYSLDIGRAHTDFAEAKLQQRLIERQLSDSEIDQLAIISMAGVASEATKYEEVRLCFLNFCLSQTDLSQTTSSLRLIVDASTDGIIMCG